jgi:D-glycero-D-manno-heptose 1,7-bisphosphate phosphatase
MPHPRRPHYLRNYRKVSLLMRAVFLDRDGVINRKAPTGQYVANLQEFEILPHTLAAAASLHRAGYRLFVVTNQRGIATGRIQKANLIEIHSKMSQQFQNAGAPISQIYCCPHDLEVGCDCRKPRPGMLFQAAREHGLDLADCWMVGDSPSDIAAGKAAGCKTAQLVDCEETTISSEPQPDIAARALDKIAQQILVRDSRLH